MKATVYSKDNCPWCVKAKNLLALHSEFEVTEIKIGKDITVEDFKAMLPHVRTVPQVFIDDKLIGGFEALDEYLKVFYAVQTG